MLTGIFVLLSLLLAGVVFLLLRPADRNGLDALGESMRRDQSEARRENAQSLKNFNDSLLQMLSTSGRGQQEQLSLFARQISDMSTGNQKHLETLRQAVEKNLEAIRTDNNTRLDEMRKTVDEKLQTALEKRLTESFKLVSERLDQVHKGLGEMQSLAAGVGDLKKVLTNVKTRGSWGEVQLGAMLAEILTPDQFAANVSPKNNRDVVEYAIVLPGKSGDTGTGENTVLLPIDAKFPMEDYQRLLDADDGGDIVAREAASKALENMIKVCAKDIQNKYLAPPKTTDFAILYLPTEGLFAEVVRRPGLCDNLQRQNRVVIAGPTTLWSILNSLQMGFRTLAIEKRSGEVWALLEAVKTEWSKYEDALSQLYKKIHYAASEVEDTQRRVRAIGRKLKTVQQLPDEKAATLLQLDETSVNGTAERQTPAE